MILVTGPRVLIRPFKIQEHDKVFASAKQAGLVLLESSERKEQTHIDKGTIVAFGPKCAEEYTAGCKEGDVIGFAKYGGKYVMDPTNDELMLVINDEDIIAVFKE